MLQSISAENDSTVKIQLKNPFPAFLGLLSMKFCSVIPKEMEELDFRENPIGTGPFKFKRWEANEKLVFRKNNLYFERFLHEQREDFPDIDIDFPWNRRDEMIRYVFGKYPNVSLISTHIHFGSRSLSFFALR